MRRRIGVALALAAVLGLAGCAAGERYPTTTAQQLQGGVQDVAAAAAAQDDTGALAKLDALQARAEAAKKAGDLDPARYLAVSRAIATVRADLTELQAAAERARLEQQLQQLQQEQQQDDKKKEPGGKGHGDHDG